MERRGRGFVLFAFSLMGLSLATCATYNPPPPEPPRAFPAALSTATDYRGNLELAAAQLREARSHLNKFDIGGARRLLNKAAAALGPAPAAPEPFRIWLDLTAARAFVDLADAHHRLKAVGSSRLAA